MNKSTFLVTQMDCPSEEQLIRMRLEPFENIQRLQFNIPSRKVQVYHSGSATEIEKALAGLNLNSQLIQTETATAAEATAATAETGKERKVLVAVLLINFVMFVLEMVFGFLSHSMGLVADSLDMLADALVYGLALFAVGGALARKQKIAKASGYFQMGLAVLGFAEVIRRFMGYGEVPVFQTMIVVSLLALAGNVASLVLLQKSKSEEVHMQASKIFTSNDIIANVGVIAAGIIVYFTHSRIPDLVIGSIVFLLVARGAVRILKLAK